MLIALLIASLLGGDTTPYFDKADFARAANVIEDAEQAASASDAMEAINREVAGLVEQRAAVLASIDQADDDRAEVDKAIEALWRGQQQAAERYIDAVFEMRAAMSAQAWSEAFGTTP